MHSMCTFLWSFYILKMYSWFVPELSEAIQDLCGETFYRIRRRHFSVDGAETLFSPTHSSIKILPTTVISIRIIRFVGELSSDVGFYHILASDREWGVFVLLTVKLPPASAASLKLETTLEVKKNNFHGEKKLSATLEQSQYIFLFLLLQWC